MAGKPEPERLPETVRAKLWCDRCRTFTRHTYEGAQRVLSAFAEIVTRFMYGCELCGRLRGWGCE